MRASHWTLRAIYPQYGSVLKKIERLAQIDAVDIHNIEHKGMEYHYLDIDFIVYHEVSDWSEWVTEILVIAKRISPNWKLNLIDKDNLLIEQYFDNAIAPISSLQSITCCISMQQNYVRVRENK